MKGRITKATKELKAAVKAVTKACRKKYGYAPCVKWDEEDCEFIFGMNSQEDDHEEACQFLWDRGVGAPLIEFLG